MKLNEIENLIKSKFQESTVLEYKASKALADKIEISKDVSAMANAEGGLIIYGVSESQNEKHFPEKLDPISTTDYDREYLDRVIASNIFPKIPNVKVELVPIDEQNFLLVVAVPKGDTAHQANDHRYYRRYNFQRLPMLDQEIRDVMNRAKTPDVTMDFEIEQKDGNTWILKPILLNNGKVLAKFVRYVFDVPSHYLEVDSRTGKPIKNEFRRNFVRFDGSNEGFQVIHAGSAVAPQRVKPLIIPIDLIKHFSGEFYFGKMKDYEDIKWIVYADDSSPREGVTRVEDIWKEYQRKLDSGEIW